MSTSLTIGTDGSCLKNPGGPSGWAWVTEHGDYQYGSIPSGTNQVAELEALLRALREHITVEDLTILADSEYAINVYSKWVRGWEQKGWRTASGSPVKNLIQVKALRRLQLIRADSGLAPVRLEWVKGHARGKHPLNDAADHWAGMGSALARETQREQTIAGRGRPVAVSGSRAPARAAS